jgi:hypothetical protein
MRLGELVNGEQLTIRRLTTSDVRIPPSPVLHAALLPTIDSIVDAVRDLVPAAKATRSPVLGAKPA